MSSPPLSEPGHGAGLFSSGRFDRERARVGREALVQDPQAVPCEELRLGDLAILSRHAVARGERMGGGPDHHALLNEPEYLAGPSAPSLGTPQLVFDLTPRTLLHAERRSPTREFPQAPHVPRWWLCLRDRKWLKSQDRPHFP